MKTHLANIWENLRSSYWFIPTVMALFSMGIALAAIQLDLRFGFLFLTEKTWFYWIKAEGAREVLSTIAGSSITVTGVVFSIIIVALSLASRQFGPRLLYNFMRDRSNQVVFGVFISTYLFCLVVLRTVRSGEMNTFVPHLSVTLALMLAVASVGVLIFFIHHAAESIQVNTIIEKVSSDFRSVLNRIYPKEITPGEAGWEMTAADRLPENFNSDSLPVVSRTSGYVQAVDVDTLMDLAQKYDLVLRIERRPGNFVLRKTPLATAYPARKAMEGKLDDRINGSFILGAKRTPKQDIEFLVRELVEIALRSLSTGVNDPFTAVTCVDFLSSMLSDFSLRDVPSPYWHDEQGDLRVIVAPVLFEDLVQTALNPLRQNVSNSLPVTLRLLEVIGTMIPRIENEKHREILLQQASLIEEASRSGILLKTDREEIRKRYLAIFKELEQSFGLTGEGR